MSRQQKATDPQALASRILAFVSADERANAVASLREYQRNYTGRAFETIADTGGDHFTANDIVAVSMLGVDIPARVSLWLLSDEGRSETSALLREVPDVPIWDDGAELSQGRPAWSLWDLLAAHKGMGRTKTSKLLAAKRPSLIPVFDKYVAGALGFDGATGYWASWQEALRTNPGIGDKARLLADEVGANHLSALRTLDIVIWMRVHGYEDSKNRLPYDGTPPPQPSLAA